MRADALDRREGVANGRFAGLGVGFHRKHHLGAVDVGRQQRDAEPAQLLAEMIELVGVAEVEGHRGGEKLDRVVGLQIGGLVGDQRIGRRMRLIEAVTGEFGHLVEDQFGAPALHPARRRAVDELLALGIHLRLDLLAHRAA